MAFTKCIFLQFLIETVKKGVQMSAYLYEENMTHPRLRQLAKSPLAILIQDRAPKTVRSYVCVIKRNSTNH